MATIEAPVTTPAAPETQAPQRVVVGQRAPKIEGVEKVTGKAKYGADVSRPGMLWGKLLASPHAHAVIKRIDTSKARAIPGVFAVLTGEDLPRLVAQVSDTTPAPEEWGPPSRAKHALAWKKVVFSGQPVAAVAALTPSIAEEALAAIDVEYEVLKPVLDVLEAMQDGAPLVHENVFTETFAGKGDKPSNIVKLTELSRGDAGRALAESDVTVEESFRTEMVHQGYIEPQATMAEYGPDGRFTIWTSTQGQFGVRSGVSGFLKIQPRRVRVFAMEIGGGFGAKGAQTLEPICALLAYASGHPVKMQLTRSEVLRATNPAPGAAMHVTIGAKRDGTLTGAKARFVWDVGSYPGGNAVGGINIGFGPYRLPAFAFEAYDVMTNRPNTRAYRAPNGPQGAFAVESALDILAEKLGIDPLELRLKNAVVEGDRNPSDVPYPKIGFVETLRAMQRHSAWTEPVPPASRPGWVRGRGIAAGTWGGGVGTSTAHVNINEDGSASVVTGAVDVAGTRTSMAQICAEELQIPYERVTVVQPDTDSAPFNNPTGGSRITYSLGTAVHRAAVDARTKLKQRAAQQMKLPPDDVEYRQGKFWKRDDPETSLTIAQVARTAIGSGEGPVIGTGEVTHLLRAPAFGVQVIEVEVDEETGLTQVVKATAAQDVGCAINPTACEGQIQGGVVQAIGWALTEEYFYDDHGRLRNPSLLDYRMPTALDAPNIECVLVEIAAADGPYGVRGTGEVPIVPGAAAIANAVHNAIGARVTQLPILGERVIAALGAGGENGKSRPAPALLAERPAVADARRSVLNAQNRQPAGGIVKLAAESEDYCAEDDVAEQPNGAAGDANGPAANRPQIVKLATESEDYCAEDDVKE